MSLNSSLGISNDVQGTLYEAIARFPPDTTWSQASLFELAPTLFESLSYAFGSPKRRSRTFGVHQARMLHFRDSLILLRGQTGCCALISLD